MQYMYIDYVNYNIQASKRLLQNITTVHASTQCISDTCTQCIITETMNESFNIIRFITLCFEILKLLVKTLLNRYMQISVCIDFEDLPKFSNRVQC